MARNEVTGTPKISDKFSVFVRNRHFGYALKIDECRWKLSGVYLLCVLRLFSFRTVSNDGVWKIAEMMSMELLAVRENGYINLRAQSRRTEENRRATEPSKMVKEIGSFCESEEDVSPSIKNTHTHTCLMYKKHP